MSDSEKIFVGGYFPKKVADTAPAFIVGEASIHVESMIKWLQEVARPIEDEQGYIRITTKDSQSGKRYAEVNTWKPAPKPEEVKDNFLPPEVKVDLGEVDPKVVPEF